MNTIKIANYHLTYSVLYKKNRKTVQLKISNINHLLITAPYRFSNENLEKIILKKSKWIIKHMLNLAEVIANPINKSINNNATVLYLGQPHTLSFLSTIKKQPSVHLESNQIILELPSHSKNLDIIVQPLLKKWYVNKALEILSLKTNLWSSRINVTPKRITIKEQKTRWGSCSSKGNINYNWRIVMAPPEVVDYLVIHELCHLYIPNHSELFWQEVAKFSPSFKQHRAWLRTNGDLLMGIL